MELNSNLKISIFLPSLRYILEKQDPKGECLLKSVIETLTMIYQTEVNQEIYNQFTHAEKPMDISELQKLDYLKAAKVLVMDELEGYLDKILESTPACRTLSDKVVNLASLELSLKQLPFWALGAKYRLSKTIRRDKELNITVPEMFNVAAYILHDTDGTPLESFKSRMMSAARKYLYDLNY